MIKRDKRLLLRLLFLVGAVALGGVAVAQTGNLTKIDIKLQEQMHLSRNTDETFRVIIEMSEQYDNPNLERGTAMMTRAQRRDYVVDELKRFSEQSQREMVHFLNEQSSRGGVTVLHRFWVFNGICCEATANSIGELSMREDVNYISLDEEMQMIEPIEREGSNRDNPPEGVQWHVSKVRANEVWTYNGTNGYTGNGVVVAIIDSGVNYEHEDIINNMWDGGALYPHHGWDFYDNDNDPRDENVESGHGSHVAGIVASHGLTYQAGIAPGASIMALKIGGVNNSIGSMYMICQAVEFALEHGADIMNLSLGGQSGQGGNYYYRKTFVNVLHAGVVATVSAGNEGFILDFENYHPAPYNIGSPGNCPPPWLNPDQYNVLPGGTSAVICVGNVNQNDKRYTTSSFGPVTWAEGPNIGSYNDYPYENGSNTNIGLIRPDVAAPGTDIWSINRNANEGYHELTGTSMAAPCVAGVIALMLEANPNLTPELIDKILEITAQPCDNQLSKNNEYGAGRIDAYQAVTAALHTNVQQTYHISVAKYPFTDCSCISVSGTGDYEPNSSCTIQASPADYFICWKKDGETVSTDATYTFTVTTNAHYEAIFEENVPDDCFYINVTDNPNGAASGGSGWGYYFPGSLCTLTVTPTNDFEFYNWTKDDEVVSWDATFTFTVTEPAIYVANFKHLYSISAEAMPLVGGTIEGCGLYAEGSHCTLTAVPNVGYVFAGWYNGTFLVSTQASYVFTVNGNRTLTAMFVPGNFTVTSSCMPASGGTVTGNQGNYPAGSTVTLTATPTAGYAFSGWMENGIRVCNNPVYTFQLVENRNLTATFSSTEYAIGSLVTNPDNSQGVVFYLDPSGTEGWMVALEDASDGCQWGPTTDIQALKEYPYNGIMALGDLSGYLNTGVIRTAQGIDNEYAASLVDYENGWYLPSSGQLRKLYAALPLIEGTITAAGGTLMTDNTYWSSTEYSASSVSTPMFNMSNTNKDGTCRVRAIHNFVAAGSNVILVSSNNSSLGTVSVSGNGTFTQGQAVTVTAMPENGCAFEYWSENGTVVSCDAVYQFNFTHARALEAHFSLAGSVGSIVSNADGTKGVVFHLSQDGTEGLMVALDDASTGCEWGPTSKVYSLVSWSFDGVQGMNDMSGARNTRGIRNYQGTENEYAATIVDFANGWYLPSAGELRKLYAALPFIEDAITKAGGTLLTDGAYWSSTEYSASNAMSPSFSMSNTNKSGNCRVRAIRSFATAGPNHVTAKPNRVGMGTTSVSGSGEFAVGAPVTVTAYPAPGYIFDSWTEAGMTVSYNPTYQFSFTRSRALTAHFVKPGSVGSTVLNSDGSRGVVFYTDPSGVSGWMVALNDASEGCVWGSSDSDVETLDNLNSISDLLSDLDGTRNTRKIRQWYAGFPEIAAFQVDYSHQWFLPTAGQLRKLYAALPMVENAIINAGGTLLTDDGYWSSTEQSTSSAWTPGFAFGTSNKSNNRRVRAIRHFYTSNIQNPHVFVGTNGTQWSDPGNWINPSRNLLSNDDDVIITTQCVVDEDATVKSLTMTYGSTISVDEGKTLAATENISNTYDTRINLGLGSQLVNPTEGTYFSMNKEIAGYGSSEDGGWYTIATPLKNGMSVASLTTGNYDLYYYHEPSYKWMNQKNTENNFSRLENGQGYLYANSADKTLNFTGQAKSSSIEVTASVTNSASAHSVRGFNLLGNPFTSNLEISNLRLNGEALSAYYKVNNGNALVAYTDADDEPIRPMEGFFIHGDEGTLVFNAPSREIATNGYVRLVLYETDKMLDRAYLKITEGKTLPKMRMDAAKAELYFRSNNIDLAIAESQEGIGEYPLYFKTKRDGTFTLYAEMLNTESEYLHLIDNMTGADIDLLETPRYTFKAKTSDYTSRFRLVFSANDPLTDSESFAYINDGNIIVIGEGVLQVVDVLGRVMRQEDNTNCISISGMTSGVYILRLINGENVRTQKIVIR